MCALQAYINLLATVTDPCNTQTQFYCPATEERQYHCRSHTARVPTFGYKFDICVVNHQLSRRGVTFILKIIHIEMSMLLQLSSYQPSFCPISLNDYATLLEFLNCVTLMMDVDILFPLRRRELEI